MGMLRTTCLTVACALVLVECYYKREDECEALVECQAPLNNYNQDVTGLSNEAMLDEFCVQAETARNCADGLKSGCSSDAVVAEVEGGESAALYICSDEGKEKTLALAESECSVDKDKELEVYEGMQNCFNTFEFDTLMLTVGAMSEDRHLDPTELCPYTHAWLECTINVAKDKCGEAYGDYILEVLTITVGKQFEELGCLDEVSRKRAALKRFIDYKAKRRVY